MSNHDHPPDLTEKLRLGDNEAFAYLYRMFYRAAASWVKANSGNEQDARDVFQEALLALFRQINRPDFHLTTDIGAYLTAIVRKIWLYRLRTRHNRPEILVPEVKDTAAYDDIELLLAEPDFEDKHKIVKTLLETLKTDCQKIIEYTYYYRLPAAEIARLLGYADVFVKVKKHRCMEVLREKVKKHPAFSDET